MAERKRGMGRGLSAILPESGAGGPELRELPVDQIEPNPDQPRTNFEAGALDALAGSIATAGLLQPLIVRPLDGRPLRAGRRRAPLARRPAGRPRPGPGGDPQLARGRAPAGGADREHGPRGPEPGRRGARLRRPGRRPRDLEGGARPPGRPQPRRDLEPDPAARPPRRGPDAARAGELSEGHGRAILQLDDQDERRKLAKRAAAEGWSVRETESRRPAARRNGKAARKAGEGRADQRRGAGRAGRRRGRARRGARRRRPGPPAGDGVKAEILADDLGELALARREAARKLRRELESSAPGRLAQLVRARL